MIEMAEKSFRSLKKKAGMSDKAVGIFDDIFVSG